MFVYISGGFYLNISYVILRVKTYCKKIKPLHKKVYVTSGIRPYSVYHYVANEENRASARHATNVVYHCRGSKGWISVHLYRGLCLVAISPHGYQLPVVTVLLLCRGNKMLLRKQWQWKLANIINKWRLKAKNLRHILVWWNKKNNYYRNKYLNSIIYNRSIMVLFKYAYKMKIHLNLFYVLKPIGWRCIYIVVELLRDFVDLKLLKIRLNNYYPRDNYEKKVFWNEWLCYRVNH